MENQLYIALKNNRLFDNLNASAFNLGDIKGTLITVTEGQILYREDNPADYIYFIVSGELNLLKKQKDGKTLSYIFTDNDYFGHEELLRQSKRKSTVVALRDSYIIGLSKNELELLISQDERILTNLQSSFGEGFSDIISTREEEETKEIPTDKEKTEERAGESGTTGNEGNHNARLNKKVTAFEESGESNYNIDIESFESPEDYEEHNEEFEIKKETAAAQGTPAPAEAEQTPIDQSLFTETPEPPMVDELETGSELAEDSFLGGISSEDELRKIDELIASEENAPDEITNGEPQNPEEIFEENSETAEAPEGVNELVSPEGDEIIFPDDAPIEEFPATDEASAETTPAAENSEELFEETETSKTEEPPTETKTPTAVEENNQKTEEQPQSIIENKPATVAEENKTKEEKLSRNQLEMLIKAAEIVNSNIKIDDALTNVVNVACNLLNADRGTLYFVDQGRSELWSKITLGEDIKEIRLKMGEGIAGWVAESGEIVNIENVQEDERFNRTFDSESGYQTKSMLCYPIKNKLGIIVGVIQLLNSSAGEFSKMDEDLLEALSIHIALALENAALVEKLLHGERISSLGKMANFLIQDIKKPILVSKRYADHLKEKDLSPDVKQVLEMMTDQLNHVADLVQTTSNYSEGTSGLRTVPSSINDVLNDFINRLDSYVRTRNSQISKEFDSDVTVKVDQKEFFQSFHHIIKNACDAMPEGGTIFVQTVLGESSVQIMIKDNGLGIPDGLREKIFEPFMTYGKKEGTGLGLSITKKIIEDHGGTIKVESQLGEGTTILIALPLANAF
ncbi:MAG: GAF domain-containing protein [Chlorobi bacterium]|nr:GAF domain-containing protein [Chlorobiota bacterium]